jgi:hypothetical protein
MRRPWLPLLAAASALLITAAPTLACGGLIGPNGAVNLLRTTTFAGYHDGVEHYVTAFEFAGGGGAFGSITPLPDIPSNVERGGDWTLQRLVRETDPVDEFAFRALAASDTAGEAEVLLETTIDALDITILRGGGRAVGDWARDHGFGLSVDAPEVLDFYAARSPVFMAVSFDARAARARGQQLGEGTPIHLTIPTTDAWVPLRILGLGHQPSDAVQADLYLLTDRRPALLPGPAAAGEPGVALERSGPASQQLLADLRSDKGMGWVPASGMWLSYLRIDTTAGKLTHDLAVDTSGRGSPSPVAAGLADPGSPLSPATPATPAGGRPGAWPWLAVALAGAAAAAGVAGLARRGQARAS